MKDFFKVLNWLTDGNGEVAMIVLLVLLLIVIVGASFNDGY